MRRGWSRAVGCAALLVLAASVAVAQGTAVAGEDWAWSRLPSAAQVEEYANAGYRMRIESGAVVVEVDLSPLESAFPFDVRVVPVVDGDLAVLARALTASSTRRYEAVSRILEWVARSVRYELDRDQPQDAISVLARRSGYCTGVARLTVALLATVGIEAREVPGFVLDAGRLGEAGGFHRWVEIFYPDRGWTFSDPLTSHHYVPASYVRLASEVLQEGEPARGASLLHRADTRSVVDVYDAAPPGVTARRNSSIQLASALRVAVAERRGGLVFLDGPGGKRRQALQDGTTTFVGLAPGSYALRLWIPGEPPEVQLVDLRGRMRGAVFFGRRERADGARPTPADRMRDRAREGDR